MIVSIYLGEHEYLIDKPQTLNFGGKYLYSFLKIGKDLVVQRKLNEKYIHDFFNVSDSSCRIKLLSAVVGQNGVGKSSILDVIRSLFVDHIYSMPHNICTVLAEVNGETKVLYSNLKTYIVVDNYKNNISIQRDFIIKKTLDGDQLPEGYNELENVNIEDFQTIYYSPHFDLKYNNNFSDVDQYDISLDQYIKEDLKNSDKKGTTENGWRFGLHEELIFKNSIRQVEFLNSEIFKNNSVFRDVFELPEYETGIIHFREIEVRSFDNTPNPLRPIIEVILERAENESKDWHIFRDQNSNLDRNLRQALINRYLLERFIIRCFISVVVDQMEKKNTWLEEGRIEDPYDRNRFEHSSAIEILFYFIKESYIEKGKYKKHIFNHEEIFPFFERLTALFEKESDPNNIKKQSIRVTLDEVKELLKLHKRIINNLLHYYPKTEGLIDKSNYTDGFISFRPTDRNMSSGENALLNFFSKLHNFIFSNLISQSQSLPNKTNYILLLDETDLGFHPVWKKKYVDAILKTLPYFFEGLEVIPDLQIIITTHDPLTLSDFPINNVVFLQKEADFCAVMPDTDRNRIQKTFGANITDLLAHSFFVEDGLVGDFSKSKIRETINWINENQKLSDSRKSTPLFQAKLEHYKRLINLIDEKVVKLKLTEMITDLVPDNNYYNQIIDNEIQFLINKKK